MKIALFGQAAFGKEVLERLLAAGHRVVGVYAPPEGGRPDPLAEEAAARRLPLFRYKRMRRKARPSRSWWTSTPAWVRSSTSSPT